MDPENLEGVEIWVILWYFHCARTEMVG